MKNVITFSLLSLLAFNTFANDAHHSHENIAAEQAAESPAQQIINTKGVVNLIDMEAKKITITHEPIPSVNWPAMTMRFTYEDPAMIANIKVNDQVNLDFIQQGNISLLKTITVVN